MFVYAYVLLCVSVRTCVLLLSVLVHLVLCWCVGVWVVVRVLCVLVCVVCVRERVCVGVVV